MEIKGIGEITSSKLFGYHTYKVKLDSSKFPWRRDERSFLFVCFACLFCRGEGQCW